MIEPASPNTSPDLTAPLQLYGRDEDVARIRTLLDSGQVRLLTLTGPGGVGKTRLAETLVSAIAPDYADGAASVLLASLTDAAQVLPAVARACGLPDRGTTDALITALQPRHLLLYLDNFEHLLDPAPTWLGELLRHCPRLTVLATSRVSLHLQREQRYPVAPLAVSAPGDAGTAPAESLFIERARAINPAFQPDAGVRETIAGLCRRLDGLPLAVELAAARIPVLTPAEILTRLEGHGELLAGGPRDAPQRHQSLQATIAWSYDLLPHDQQHLFEHLGVFHGGFTLAAAEAVCGPPAGPITDVLGGIGALIDASLVQALPTPDGSTRYRLLETIRAFALERLVSGGEEHAVRDRHATWYLDHVSGTVGELDTLGQALAIDALEADYPDLIAALGWIAASGNGERLLGFVLALHQYWNFGGDFTEGLSWYQRALDLIPGEEAANRMDVLLAMISLAHVIDDPGTDDLIARASSVAARSGTVAQRAEAAFHVALRAEDQGDYETAEAAFTDSMALYGEANATWDVLVCEYHLGVVALGQGNLAAARKRLDSVREAAGPLGDPFTPLWALTYLIMIACEDGDEARATALLREHPAPDHLGYKHHRQGLWIAAATLASLRGEHEAAVRWCAAASNVSAVYEPDARYVHQVKNLARAELGDQRLARATEQGVRLHTRQVEAEIVRLLTPGSPAPGDRPAAPASIRLSPREREVLALLAEGKTNQEIADTLFISLRTAGNHVANILAKLELGSRTAAVAWAIRHNLV